MGILLRFWMITLMASAMPMAAVAAPSCQDLFSKPALTDHVTSAAGRATSEVAAIVRRLRAPPFQIERYDRALESYRSQGEGPFQEPKNREERLAFLTYVSQSHGRNPYDLELWARRATPKEMRRMADAIGGFKIEKGFSPTRIDSIYWTLFLFSSPDPRTFKNLSRLTINQMDRLTLEQWTTKEIASSNAVEAFEKLGLLRDPALRKQWTDTLREHPNTVATIATGAMITLEMYALGSPISAPLYSRLRTTRLDPELRDLIEREGFDAAYPLLKRRYGRLVDFDRGFYFGRRFMAIGLMSFMLAHMYPTLIHELVPAERLAPNASVLAVTEEVLKYYVELGGAMIPDRMGHVSQPHHAATPGLPKAAAPVNESRVSAGRVPLTYDQQLSQDANETASSPTSSVGTADASGSTSSASQDDQNSQAIHNTLPYLNSLNFSGPTRH